jgi:hypothetical protein
MFSYLEIHVMPAARARAAECRLLERLRWLGGRDRRRLRELMEPAIALGHVGVEILRDESLARDSWAVLREMLRFDQLTWGEFRLSVDAERVAVLTFERPARPMRVMRRVVPDAVECPAMPSAVDGLLPPDLLRAVCGYGRDQLALVARSWRAALRPVVGRQVVEGRGWAAWILPMGCGEWVERSVATDVLARVARAWRRRYGPISVGPSAADLELALELAPAELCIVDYYATDVVWRADLLSRHPGKLETLYLQVDLRSTYDLRLGEWIDAASALGLGTYDVSREVPAYEQRTLIKWTRK